MGYILKNKFLEILIDYPEENYISSRFDWTGKIKHIIFINQKLTGYEKYNDFNDEFHGQGLYNEFGIHSPLGFDEVKIGEWFHKIGVGLLKKENNKYDFLHYYIIKPATFSIKTQPLSIEIICNSEVYNGYGYVLAKKISLKENKVQIKYKLENKGLKRIKSSEYIHNFIQLNSCDSIKGSRLNLDFNISQNEFERSLNPNNSVVLSGKTITFSSTPDRDYYFSNLSGGEEVSSKWIFSDLDRMLCWSESGNFSTKKISLWGNKNVLSPELFIEFDLAPNKILTWERNYTFKTK